MAVFELLESLHSFHVEYELQGISEIFTLWTLHIFFSGQNAQEAGRLAKLFAEKSYMFASKQAQINISKEGKSSTKMPILGPMAVSIDGLSPKAQKLHKEVKEFVRELIIPVGE